jgi:DNA-binding LacI/PurR family transcriptional regulator
MQPTLSTIGASRLSWGALAAAQLIDFLEDEKPFQAIRIPTRLIQRESSSKNLLGVEASGYKTTSVETS